MRVLIVGGGSVGGRLALELKDPFTLIEADPSRAYQLQQQLDEAGKDHLVLFGDGSDHETLAKAMRHGCDAAVILMNKDHTNLEAVSQLSSLGMKRIIARVNNPANMQRFVESGAEVFLHPIGYEEGIIKTLLYPDMKHLLQIFVRSSSPAVGKRISEMGLPEGAVITNILRMDAMVPPEPGMEIKRGDLIAIDAVGSRARDVWRIFSKSGRSESAGHIIFPLIDEQSISSIKEAEVLSKRMGSEIVLVVGPGKEALVSAARGLVSRRIPMRVLAHEGVGECRLEGRTTESMSVRRLPRSGFGLMDIMNDHMKEGSAHLDLMMVPIPKKTILYTPFLSSNLDYLIDRAPMPVLVARAMKPYRKILLYLHGGDGQDVSTAIQIARVSGSEIKAIYHGEMTKRAQYMRRFASVYGVNTELRRIQGNPTVEFIREVREGDHDLVILKKGIREIQRSQFRRLVHLWKGSVLVI